MAGTKKEEGKVYSENWGGIRENSGGTRAGAGADLLQYEHRGN